MKKSRYQKGTWPFYFSSRYSCVRLYATCERLCAAAASSNAECSSSDVIWQKRKVTDACHRCHQQQILDPLPHQTDRPPDPATRTAAVRPAAAAAGRTDGRPGDQCYENLRELKVCLRDEQSAGLAALALAPVILWLAQPSHAGLGHDDDNSNNLTMTFPVLL